MVSQTDRTCQGIFRIVSFGTRLVVDQYIDRSFFKHFYFSSCFGFFVLESCWYWLFSKNSGFSPQIIHFIQGFSMIFTIHFGVFPLLLGNTHLALIDCAGRVQLGLPLCGSSLGPRLEDADDSIATWPRCGWLMAELTLWIQSGYTPEDERLEHVLMEVWFRWFSLQKMGDFCRFQPLIFQGVKVKITPPWKFSLQGKFPFAGPLLFKTMLNFQCVSCSIFLVADHGIGKMTRCQYFLDDVCCMMMRFLHVRKMD